MKHFTQALLAAVLFSLAQSASALIVTAKLTDFESTPINVSNAGTGGGRGTFELMNINGVIADTRVANELAGGFTAVCLEPNSYISTGQAYHFALVDLGAAPTNAPGIGPFRQLILEGILARTGFTGMGDLSLTGVAAVTALLYEAGYETAGNPLDLDAGDAIITGAGVLNAKALQFSTAVPDRQVSLYALINIGQAGVISPFTVWEGQDFAFGVYTVDEEVPSPAPLALLGAGLVGMVGLRKRALK